MGLYKNMPNALQQAIAEQPVDWTQYASLAQNYLARAVFEGTPITGQMLSSGAQNAYDKYGVLVPLELALAQAQFETSMGRKGRNPATNPYNVGEYDEGTKLRFDDLVSGVNAYYDLMAKDYLKNQTLDQLLNNFVNYRGSRYASDPEYENKISQQIQFIRKFLGR